MFFVAAQHPYICCTFSQELHLGHRQLISSADCFALASLLWADGGRRVAGSTPCFAHCYTSCTPQILRYPSQAYPLGSSAGPRLNGVPEDCG